MYRCAFTILLLLPCAVAAQAERYELGQRLKAFERAWEQQTDPAARKQALKLLPDVTPKFFAFQLGEAGRILDEARWKLEGKEPSDAERWVTSLYAMPEKTLYLRKEKEVKVTVRPFYKMKSEMPQNLQVQLGFPGSPKQVFKITTLPAEFTIPLPAEAVLVPVEDHDSLMLIQLGCGVATANCEIMVSLLTSTPKMMPDLGDATLKNKELRIILATQRHFDRRCLEMLEGTIHEADFPAGRFHHGSRLPFDKHDTHDVYFDRAFRTEQTYLAIPTTEKQSVVVRVMRPKRIENKTDEPKRPVVIALHGAGGSENLFFEGYGNGHIVKECEKRGWILVAPRSPISFSKTPPIKEILDGLELFYPIDRTQVLLVGHSMGAMQVMALAQEHPEWYAGVAALGGGGRITDAKALAKLPIFIGCGDKDFALGGAKSLFNALDKGGAKNVIYKEYPDLEHLVIVREALPDVFKEWDKHVIVKPPRKVN